MPSELMLTFGATAMVLILFMGLTKLWYKEPPDWGGMIYV